jgi:hypothetical protein
MGFLVFLVNGMAIRENYDIYYHILENVWSRFEILTSNRSEMFASNRNKRRTVHRNPDP